MIDLTEPVAVDLGRVSMVRADPCSIRTYGQIDKSAI